MIRINLLSFRAARKKENIRREISTYALTLILLIVLMVYFESDTGRSLTKLTAEEEAARKELAVYEKYNRMAAQLKTRLKETGDKLAVIRDLEARKGGPLEVLQDIAFAVPEDRLWLESIVDKGGTLTITGMAMDNDMVALFMTNLEKAASISSVDLRSTQLKDVPKPKDDSKRKGVSKPKEAPEIKASSFVITCRTVMQQIASATQQKETQPKGKPK